MKNMFLNLTAYKLLKIIIMLYQFQNLVKNKTLNNKNVESSSNIISVMSYILSVKRIKAKLIF